MHFWGNTYILCIDEAFDLRFDWGQLKWTVVPGSFETFYYDTFFYLCGAVTSNHRDYKQNLEGRLIWGPMHGRQASTISYILRTAVCHCFYFLDFSILKIAYRMVCRCDILELKDWLYPLLPFQRKKSVSFSEKVEETKFKSKDSVCQMHKTLVNRRKKKRQRENRKTVENADGRRRRNSSNSEYSSSDEVYSTKVSQSVL